jgi:hypothetical protein
MPLRLKKKKKKVCLGTLLDEQRGKKKVTNEAISLLVGNMGYFNFPYQWLIILAVTVTLKSQ